MDQIIRVLNALAISAVVVGGGYLTYDSAGRGFLMDFAEPDDSWFRTAVLQSTKPVVVKFGATWCPPCRAIEGELDRLAKSDKVEVVKIDVDKNHALARNYRVSAIPDVFLFNHGAAVAHRVGYADYDELQKWVKQKLSH